MDLKLIKFKNGKYGVASVGFTNQQSQQFLGMGMFDSGNWWESQADIVQYAQTRFKWIAKRAMKRYKVNIDFDEVKE